MIPSNLSRPVSFLLSLLLSLFFQKAWSLAFREGDILFLHMTKEPIRAGEIVVVRQIPTVHRAIKVHERRDIGEVDVLTKGDNNCLDDNDLGLYADGQIWLHRHHIMSRAVGFLPYAGWWSVILIENPIIMTQTIYKQNGHWWGNGFCDTRKKTGILY